MLLNESVPQRVRGALNVESGLNNGLVAPPLMAMLAAVALVIQRFGRAGHERLFGVVVLTVFLSVFLHGITAAPLSSAYGRSVQKGRAGVF